jgi:hypothetical protein
MSCWVCRIANRLNRDGSLVTGELKENTSGAVPLARRHKAVLGADLAKDRGQCANIDDDQAGRSFLAVVPGLGRGAGHELKVTV